VDVTLTFSSDCTWESGEVCLNEEEDCCYSFVLEGLEDDNRYCDFKLTAYEGETKLWELMAIAGDPEVLTLEFPPFSLPCCEGQWNGVVTE
jgi:hypothetical protein